MEIQNSNNDNNSSNNQDLIEMINNVQKIGDFYLDPAHSGNTSIYSWNGTKDIDYDIINKLEQSLSQNFESGRPTIIKWNAQGETADWTPETTERWASGLQKMTFSVLHSGRLFTENFSSSHNDFSLPEKTRDS